jgi:acetyl-CoA/propionyl-CoA carboxylase biotin carboxyl carrier protein
MNTRLQVEHPITELVSGLDLVREQILVASGEPLSFTQEDMDPRGHAIEVRINAENPAGGKFIPAPGRITSLVPPQGYGVRWDAGYQKGDEVSQFYDNLVGKLCVWGADRDLAIGRMLRALDEFEIEGIATTIPADVAILEHPDFRAAQHSTKWVEDVLDLTGVDSAPAGSAADDTEAKVKRDIDVEVNGRRYAVSMWVPASAGTPVAATGGGTAAPRARRSGSKSGVKAAGAGKIAAPMQGTVTKVSVAVGDEVAQGATVCVLEAMKMENNITADKDGTIAEIRIEPGQAVSAGDLLVVIS